MKRLVTIILFLVFYNLNAQQSCEPYGSKIFQLMIEKDSHLKDEFVGLLEYQSYVDRLQVDSLKKEMMKEHAIDNYIILKKSFYKEANRILDVYQEMIGSGAEMNYQYCSFKVNPKYPGIGFIQLFYLVELNDEIIDDSVSFECIYTSEGWKIIDGFYQENP